MNKKTKKTKNENVSETSTIVVGPLRHLPTPPCKQKGGLNTDVSFKTPIFIIERLNDETEEREYFGGFINVVKNIGTEDEEQHWGNEVWERDIDKAVYFETPSEAKEFEDVIDSYCDIVLYGWSQTPGFDGSHWFPLKQFY